MTKGCGRGGGTIEVEVEGGRGRRETKGCEAIGRERREKTRGGEAIEGEARYGGGGKSSTSGGDDVKLVGRYASLQ